MSPGSGKSDSRESRGSVKPGRGSPAFAGRGGLLKILSGSKQPDSRGSRRHVQLSSGRGGLTPAGRGGPSRSPRVGAVRLPRVAGVRQKILSESRQPDSRGLRRHVQLSPGRGSLTSAGRGGPSEFFPIQGHSESRVSRESRGRQVKILRESGQSGVHPE